MKVKSPLTFRNKDGAIVAIGDAVDESELKAFGLSIAPEPYETKVVRQVAADAPRAVTVESVKPATKKTVRKTAKKK